MSVRTRAGSTPTSRAPVSLWITERIARPRVVRCRNATSTPIAMIAMARATRLPRRMATPRTSTGPPPIRRLKASLG